MQTFPLPEEELLDKDGSISDEWKRYLSTFFLQFQNNLNSEGFLIPQNDSATVDEFVDLSKVANLTYDSGRKKFITNIDGVLYYFNLTPV